MMHERKRESRGFSLAEVLVATALLSVILLAMFGLVTQGVRRAYGGKKMTEATVLAQAVLERANIAAPQSLLGAAGTATTPQTVTWEKIANNKIDTSVTPAASGATTVAAIEQNRWRALLRDSDLPTNGSGSANAATLTVTMTPMPQTPTARSFDTAATVRVVVEVSWIEFGQRRRTVRLQTFNVRSITT